ncbi:MAG: DUF1801 domain-containing protein [bacterium]
MKQVSKVAEVQKYLESLTELQRELLLELREIVLTTDLKIEESIKWGSVCFSLNGNICGYRVAKAHVTLLFFEGSMLNDTQKILSGDGPKARTIKYTGKETLNKTAIQDLVKQAITLNTGK